MARKNKMDKVKSQITIVKQVIDILQENELRAFEKELAGDSLIYHEANEALHRVVHLLRLRAGMTSGPHSHEVDGVYVGHDHGEQ